MLVPVVAFLTRAMLTAEPDAARACVAAAAGPVRAQLATLIVPLGAGAVIGVVAAIFDVLTAEAAAMLSTLAAIILALAAGVSPANAAISHTTAQVANPVAAHWPGPAALLGAVLLLAVTWGVSVLAATRRDTWSAISA